jgi:hypothetical protein
VEEVVMAQVHQPLTPAIQVTPEVTQATSDALSRSLAKNPADRFLSYDEFIMALEIARSMLLRQQTQVVNPSSEPKRTTSWWRRK